MNTSDKFCFIMQNLTLNLQIFPHEKTLKYSHYKLTFDKLFEEPFGIVLGGFIWTLESTGKLKKTRA